MFRIPLNKFYADRQQKIYMRTNIIMRTTYQHLPLREADVGSWHVGRQAIIRTEKVLDIM